MKYKLTILLLLSWSLSKAQSAEGVWYGTASNSYMSATAKSKLVLEISLVAGNKYQIKGKENYGYYTTTFEAECFIVAGITRLQYSDFKRIKVYNNRTNAYEPYVHYKQGLALCEDSKHIIFGYDDKTRYLQQVCAHDYVIWSLTSELPPNKIPLVVLPTTQLRFVSSIPKPRA